MVYLSSISRVYKQIPAEREIGSRDHTGQVAQPSVKNVTTVP